MTIKSIDWIRMSREGGSVTRYHSCRTIGNQSVAEHSFGVAMIVLWLTEGSCSNQLIKSALYHDLAEQHTGDIPAPIKKAEGAVKEMFDRLENNFMKQYELHTSLTFEDEYILKWADTLELLCYCTEQYELGNRKIKQVFDKGYAYTFNYPSNSRGEQLREELKRRIENAS